MRERERGGVERETEVKAVTEVCNRRVPVNSKWGGDMSRHPRRRQGETHAPADYNEPFH